MITEIQKAQGLKMALDKIVEIRNKLEQEYYEQLRKALKEEFAEWDQKVFEGVMSQDKKPVSVTDRKQMFLDGVSVQGAINIQLGYNEQ
jgi:hypothetical protein